MESRRPNRRSFCHLLKLFSPKSAKALHDTLRRTRCFSISGVDMVRNNRMFSSAWAARLCLPHCTLWQTQWVKRASAALYLSGLGTPPQGDVRQPWGHGVNECWKCMRRVWAKFSPQESVSNVPKIRFTRDKDNVSLRTVGGERK